MISPSNKCKAGSLDLLVDVQRAMKTYPEFRAIQVNGCAAITQFVAGNAANKARAEDLDVLADVQSAAQRSRRDGEVKFWSSKAISVLS